MHFVLLDFETGAWTVCTAQQERRTLIVISARLFVLIKIIIKIFLIKHWLVVLKVNCLNVTKSLRIEFYHLLSFFFFFWTLKRAFIQLKLLVIINHQSSMVLSKSFIIMNKPIIYIIIILVLLHNLISLAVSYPFPRCISVCHRSEDDRMCKRCRFREPMRFGKRSQDNNNKNLFREPMRFGKRKLINYNSFDDDNNYLLFLPVDNIQLDNN